MGQVVVGPAGGHLDGGQDGQGKAQPGDGGHLPQAPPGTGAPPPHP